MTYDLRHDFMANAVDQYKFTFLPVSFWIKPIFGQDHTYIYMKDQLNQKERNDWFDMYKMGGQPFPQHNNL